MRSVLRFRILEAIGRMVRGLGLVLMLAAGWAPALAADLEGRVVSVRDGDTIDLLMIDNVRVRVRLAGIDAPEFGQPFGKAARQALSSMVYNQKARVVGAKEDAYGRRVAKLIVHGADINLRMVERGMAWHYTAYASEQSALDRKRYAKAEAAARAQRRGLWQDADPVPPWKYRHQAAKPSDHLAPFPEIEPGTLSMGRVTRETE